MDPTDPYSVCIDIQDTDQSNLYCGAIIRTLRICVAVLKFKKTTHVK